ncbi:MAG TPA: DUF2182 domain-containing protein [Phenylobacterium sp.]|nr:DUF2182 domain-containing protein [Phenylobacterium sp.]
MSEASALERLLRRDRLVSAAALALLCALAWAYVSAGAGLGMSALDMTRLSLFPHRTAAPEMPGMPTASMDWGLATWALVVAMWQAMMVAMMAPTAAPAILLYARVCRHAQARGGATGLAPTWAFAAGYLLIWLAFAVAAAALQWALQRAGLISAAMMGSQSRWLSAGVLAIAGLYQLSPLQGACLDHCRSPAAFLTRRWRPGPAGAMRLGVEHGLYCLGCCGLLMVLLFVGGVMNLAWIAALTLVVLAEKLLPGGRWTARAAGVLLLAWSAATLVL